MPTEQITVYRLGDQFEARDSNNNLITDRAILEQLAFEQMPGFRASYSVLIDMPEATNKPTPKHININIRT